MWARDGNEAPSHDYAYEESAHQRWTGKHRRQYSGKSIAYWRKWDHGVVELRDN